MTNGIITRWTLAACVRAKHLSRKGQGGVGTFSEMPPATLGTGTAPPADGATHTGSSVNLEKALERLDFKGDAEQEFWLSNCVTLGELLRPQPPPL